MQRSLYGWDHSCLDGTITPTLCTQRHNNSSSSLSETDSASSIPQQCVTILYKLNGQGTKGKKY